MSTLKELEPLKVSITLGGEQMYLRYDLNSRRYMEEFLDYKSLMQKNAEDWTAEEIIHLLRAGLIDFFFEENEKAIENHKFEDIIPSMSFIGRNISDENILPITMQILDAIVKSLPDTGGENFKKAAEK